MCYNNRNPARHSQQARDRRRRALRHRQLRRHRLRMAFGAEPTRAIGVFENDPAVRHRSPRERDPANFPTGQATLLISTQAGPIDRRLASASRRDRRDAAGCGWISRSHASGAAACRILIGDERQHRLTSRARDDVRAGQPVHAAGRAFLEAGARREGAAAFRSRLGIANMRVLDALRRSGETGAMGECVSVNDQTLSPECRHRVVQRSTAACSSRIASRTTGRR